MDRERVDDISESVAIIDKRGGWSYLQAKAERALANAVARLQPDFIMRVGGRLFVRKPGDVTNTVAHWIIRICNKT